MRPSLRRGLWIAACLALLVGGAAVAVRVLDDPARRYMEAEVNRRLTGYTVSIPKLRLHLLSTSIEVREVTIASQRFALRDWVLLFGAFLLNGAAFLTAGLIAWVLGPRAPVSRALLAIGVALIERRFARAGAWAAAAALLSAFGVIHAYDLGSGGVTSRFGWMAAPDFFVGYLFLAGLFFLVGTLARNGAR